MGEVTRWPSPVKVQSTAFEDKLVARKFPPTKKYPSWLLMAGTASARYEPFCSPVCALNFMPSSRMPTASDANKKPPPSTGVALSVQLLITLQLGREPPPVAESGRTHPDRCSRPRR